MIIIYSKQAEKRLATARLNKVAVSPNTTTTTMKMKKLIKTAATVMMKPPPTLVLYIVP